MRQGERIEIAQLEVGGEAGSREGRKGREEERDFLGKKLNKADWS